VVRRVDGSSPGQGSALAPETPPGHGAPGPGSEGSLLGGQRGAGSRCSIHWAAGPAGSVASDGRRGGPAKPEHRNRRGDGSGERALTLAELGLVAVTAFRALPSTCARGALRALL
jgi:hypothetical protein